MPLLCKGTGIFLIQNFSSMFKEKNKIKQIIYQVDAFTDELFRGNPAAVCIMEEWIPDEKMQLIAMENNLAETAFIVKEGVNYHIRWFTPTLEVDLCGHATIASAYVIFNTIELQDSTISFISKSGILVVNKEISGLLTLDFPSDQPKVVTDFPSILF